MKRTEAEIREQIDEAIDARNDGGKFNSMSYEEGVIAGLEWALGDNNDKPMED